MTTPFSRTPRRPDFESMMSKWGGPRGRLILAQRAERRDVTRGERARTATSGLSVTSAAVIGLLLSVGATPQGLSVDTSVDQQGVLGVQRVPEIAAVVSPEETDLVTERVAIDYEVVRQEDPTRPVGTETVATSGQTGIELRTVAVSRIGSSEVGREKVVGIVLSAPVDQVVLVGTKKPLAIPATSNAGDNRAIGMDRAAARGWSGDQWDCLNALWTRESGWKHNADNPNSSAYGIPQALPGSKMATAGDDWLTNPATQIEWGLTYISGRYGTPCGAWEHSETIGWY